MIQYKVLTKVSNQSLSKYNTNSRLSSKKMFFQSIEIKFNRVLFLMVKQQAPYIFYIFCHKKSPCRDLDGI